MLSAVVNVFDTWLPQPDSSIDEPGLKLRNGQVVCLAHLLLLLLARVRIQDVPRQPPFQSFRGVSGKRRTPLFPAGCAPRAGMA